MKRVVTVLALAAALIPGFAIADAMPEMATISYWQAEDYAKLPSGGVGLVNLNDGMLGATPDQIAQYKKVISESTARGVRFFAYVPTGYGERDPAKPNEGGTMGQSMEMIHAQVDAWDAAFPGQLMGIFFDETSQTCETAAVEYPELSAYVRSKGMQVAVWNPGWVGDGFCYIKAAPAGDIVVTFEADLNSYATDEFVPKDLADGHKIARERGVKTWNLVHTARGPEGLKQALDLIRDRAPDYAYVTDKQDWQIEDTWGAPPSYWEAELQCLQSGICP